MLNALELRKIRIIAAELYGLTFMVHLELSDLDKTLTIL